ncbi:MAG: alpha/beta hydrolase fold domain-containing protein [Pseudoxanthomonas sp.]
MNTPAVRSWLVATAILLSMVMSSTAFAQNDSKDETATVALPAAPLPYSTFASPQARSRFAGLMEDTRAGKGPDSADIADQRRFYQRYNDDRLREVQRLYRADVEHGRLGGVPVDIVVPEQGIASGNQHRVLINLHGGAFMWGAGSGALVEAIPIAVTGGIRVVAVDYRLAPEHRYPAGSEDVEAVYRELLKQYRAENIGIYGCSAGGALTAQATAWMRSHGLPRPGAIGTFCATGLPLGGDSATLGALAVGTPPMDSEGGGARLPYLARVSPADPLAYPGLSKETLAGFPPTLLLAGSRDFSASSLTTMHRRLLAAGVDADLVLFDGLWHAFFVFPDLPESQETYGIVARFFDRHLGRAPRQTED